jgi:hypothetical protein
MSSQSILRLATGLRPVDELTIAEAVAELEQLKNAYRDAYRKERELLPSIRGLEMYAAQLFLCEFRARLVTRIEQLLIRLDLHDNN